MKLELQSKKREAVFVEIAMYLKEMGFTVASSDFDRPWGGFFVIDEGQTKEFVDHFFPSVELSTLRIGGKLTPKILAVEPLKRLSWQYHHRRAEIWRSVFGAVGVTRSFTNIESEVHKLIPGQEVRLAQGQRHRLVGLEDWGVVAEIWQHTDVTHPSNENDIVRLQDDFGR